MDLNGKVKHILRYGTAAEQVHLESMIDTYDLLTINGNMVAFIPGTIANFLVNNFISKKDKGYFIDPLTHAFQHNIDLLKSKKTKKNPNPTIKSSIRKMIEIYGEPVESIIKAEDLIIPEDFNDNNLKNNFCKNVLQFQLETVIKQLEEKGLLKYIEYNSDFCKEDIYPEFLIAPYFYMDSNTYDDWLPLNIDFIQRASTIIKENEYNKPLFAQLVISKDLLSNNTKIEKITQEYCNIPAEGVAIWIDDFNEHEVDDILLANYVKLIKKLSSSNKIVYNLYGSFFSIMLTLPKFNCDSYLLNGVGHGLEYGESRAVVPVGGGIPTSKYYYYPLHQRIDFSLAYNLLTYLKIIDPGAENSGDYEKYKDKICNCKVCVSLLAEGMDKFTKFESTDYYNVRYKTGIQRRKKATKETKELCLLHYLYCKENEFKEISSLDKSTILDNLSSSYETYKKSRKIPLEQLSYLKNWRKIIETYCWGEILWVKKFLF